MGTLPLVSLCLLFAVPNPAPQPDSKPEPNAADYSNPVSRSFNPALAAKDVDKRVVFPADVSAFLDRANAGNSNDGDLLKVSIDQALKYVRSTPGAFVLIGRVVLPGGGLPDNVSAQMRISEQGYFATPVRNRKDPIGLAYRGCEPVILDPSKFPPGEMVLVPEIVLAPVAPKRLGAISGCFKLKPHQPMPQVSVSVTIPQVPPNHYGATNGPGIEAQIGEPREEPPLDVKMDGKGCFRAEGLAPTTHRVEIGSGEDGYARTVDVKPGKTVELTDLKAPEHQKLPTTLLSYLVANRPPFDASKVKTAVVRHGGGFRPEGAPLPELFGSSFDIYVGRGGWAALNASYVPWHLYDLGPGKLADFASLKGPPSSVEHPVTRPVQAGHVYLLNHDHFHYWALVRFDGFGHE